MANLPPLQPFLMLLKSEGIQITLRDHQRLSLALQKADIWTHARLRQTLCSLLAKNLEQITIIEKQFDVFFNNSTIYHNKQNNELTNLEFDIRHYIKELKSLETLAPRPIPTPISQDISFSNEISQTTKKPKNTLITWCKAIFIIGIITLLNTSPVYIRPAIELTPAPSQEITHTAPSVKEPEPTPKPAKKQLAQINYRTFNNTPITTITYSDFPKQNKQWFKHWLYATFITLAALLYSFFLYQSVKIPTIPTSRNNSKTPNTVRRFSLLNVGGKPTPRIKQPILDQMAEAISIYSTHQPTTNIDIQKTIDATLAKGGIPTFLYEKVKQTCRVVILEQKQPTTATNTSARELANGLQQRGLDVVHGTFTSTLRKLYSTKGRPFSFYEFTNAKHSIATFIFSDNKSFTSNDWLELKQLSTCIWFDFEEPQFWQNDHQALLNGIPTYTADEDGLKKALQFLNDKSRLLFSNNEIAKLPSFVNYNSTVAELYLGKALQWAQDCAILQPTSPGLQDAIRSQFYPSLSAILGERFKYLPNTRITAEGLIFSDETTKILKQGFSQRNFDKQQAVISFIKTKLAEVKPSHKQDASYADWLVKRTILDIEYGCSTPDLSALLQPNITPSVVQRLSHIDLKNKLEPTALAQLADIPNNPFQITKRKFKPLSQLQFKVTFSLFCVFTIALLSIIFDFITQDTKPKKNWQFQGLNTPAMIRAHDGNKLTRIYGDTATLAASLPRLDINKPYTLFLYGDHWHKQTLQLNKEQQLSVNVNSMASTKLCETNLLPNLQVIMCSSTGKTPSQSWSDKITANDLKANYKNRKLSIGIELLGRSDATLDNALYDQLISSSSLDYIFRVTKTNSQPIITATDNLILQTIFDSLPLSQTQIVWWGSNTLLNNRFRELIREHNGLQRSLQANFFDERKTQQMLEQLQSNKFKQLNESTLLSTLSLSDDAIIGEGEPITLFSSPQELNNTINEIDDIENLSQPLTTQFNYDVWKDTAIIQAGARSSHSANSITFNYNGKQLLTGSYDNSVKVWNTDNGELIKTFTFHKSKIITIKTLPYNTVFSASQDGTVFHWNSSEYSKVQPLFDQIRVFSKALFDHNGEQLFVTDSRHDTLRFNVHQPNTLARDITYVNKNSILALSPDGKHILLNGSDNTLYLRDINTGTIVSSFKGHIDWISAAVFSQNNQYLLTSSYDKTIKLWNTATGELMQSFNGHSSYVYTVDFAPNNVNFVSGSHDKTIKLWAINMQEPLTSLDSHNKSVNAVKFSPDGGQLATVDISGKLIIWKNR